MALDSLVCNASYWNTEDINATTVARFLAFFASQLSALSDFVHHLCSTGLVEVVVGLVSRHVGAGHCSFFYEHNGFVPAKVVN